MFICLEDFNIQCKWLHGTEEQKEVLDFNNGFEIYNKNIMYGSDIISAINKAIDNNKRYGTTNDKTSDYYVDIVVKTIFTLSASSNPDKDAKDLLESDFKTKTYKCTNITYNNIGRISKMQFELIK